jgi:hypothetical protein
MTAGGFNKTGWHWTTRHGWKRTPRRLQGVKKTAKATKRRPFKMVPVQPAAPEKRPTFAEARKLAAGQGRGKAAPSPMPDAATLPLRPPRHAWHGKYDALTTPQEARP